MNGQRIFVKTLVYKDESIAIRPKAYCKFKINGKLTHAMRLEVLPSLFFQNYDTSTLHFMPYITFKFCKIWNI